jgi:hypothetical protein
LARWGHHQAIYQQQVSQVLFTFTSNIKVKSLKMLKPQVTQQVYAHTATTASYKGRSLLCGGVVATMYTYA